MAARRPGWVWCAALALVALRVARVGAGPSVGAVEFLAGAPAEQKSIQRQRQGRGYPAKSPQHCSETCVRPADTLPNFSDEVNEPKYILAVDVDGEASEAPASGDGSFQLVMTNMEGRRFACDIPQNGSAGRRDAGGEVWHVRNRELVPVSGGCISARRTPRGEKHSCSCGHARLSQRVQWLSCHTRSLRLLETLLEEG